MDIYAGILKHTYLITRDAQMRLHLRNRAIRTTSLQLRMLDPQARPAGYHMMLRDPQKLDKLFKDGVP